MSIDQTYLLRTQYRTDQNLQTRINLYRQFSQNPHPWHHWVFDHLKLPSDARILELGCGPGWLWRENLARISADWRILLSDFSSGMVQVAHQHLNQHTPRFAFSVFDAQSLPLAPHSVDAIIANHMLYHVPDRTRTYAEIQRVLRPGGLFMAATNGATHMQDLHALLQRFDPAWDGSKKPLSDFTLEEAAEELAKWFPIGTTHRYANTLSVTEAEPLVAHIFSHPRLRDEQRVDFLRFVEQELDKHGALTITPEMGACICTC